MPFECKYRVVADHSFTIVGDPHQAAAAELDVDLDARRSGVDRVFDKLFYDRRGTLDHLAGGDLVGQIVR